MSAALPDVAALGAGAAHPPVVGGVCRLGAIRACLGVAAAFSRHVAAIAAFPFPAANCLEQAVEAFLVALAARPLQVADAAACFAALAAPGVFAKAAVPAYPGQAAAACSVPVAAVCSASVSGACLARSVAACFGLAAAACFVPVALPGGFGRAVSVLSGAAPRLVFFALFSFLRLLFFSVRPAGTGSLFSPAWPRLPSHKTILRTRRRRARIKFFCP
ncbi:MAG: hypothetical protein LBO03_01255 [Acidaminococcales bacterium]|nr:hypothetical protein [Acidaminococcales bacterium]